MSLVTDSQFIENLPTPRAFFGWRGTDNSWRLPRWCRGSRRYGAGADPDNGAVRKPCARGESARRGRLLCAAPTGDSRGCAQDWHARPLPQNRSYGRGDLRGSPPRPALLYEPCVCADGRGKYSLRCDRATYGSYNRTGTNRCYGTRARKLPERRHVRLRGNAAGLSL